MASVWDLLVPPRAQNLTVMSHELGRPGEFPYTRGIYRDMYRSRPWTMRQYAGFGTAEESNRRYRYLISQGTTGLSVAFDLPTQIGLDSDHPLAAGEVGRVGVAISSLADMERLFEGIPLDKVSTSMTINSTAAILLCLYVLVARRQGADIRKLSGTVQNDILKEYIARGTYIYPPRPAMRIITDLFAWAGRELPEWNTISISGYHIREAGPRPCRKWRSLSPTPSPISKRRWRRAWRSTPSRRGFRSFSTRTTTFWKRSPSSARRGGFTPS